MQASRNPAKSRPLTANVKRLMRLARASPQNDRVIKVDRKVTARDLSFCHKQGTLFMEAATMGLEMEDFAPRFMNSQLAGVFDVSFSAKEGQESNDLSNLVKLPMLLQNPGAVVEALYWIDDIIERTQEGENKSLALSQAYEAEKLKLPAALEELPDEQNRDVGELSYAYWLGYIYRCECLLHEESSRMVYGAFTEKTMRSFYTELMKSPIADKDLMESADEICAGLDRLLVEKIWPAKKERKRRRQAKELERPVPTK